MAFSLISKTLGHCFVDLEIHNNKYLQFKISLLPELCTKVIFGQDFMQMDKSAKFYLEGPMPSLTVCMTVDPPSLFPNLTDDLFPN